MAAAVQKATSSEYKVFNDPVHGKIRLHPLLVHIIDTPQFQRLRNIKQLGTVYYVYPGASHNRFEHCIGTCHLAGLLVRHLQKQLVEEGQPKDVTISEKEVLCVEIAALCHDLGHGPFSHSFDNNFMKHFDKNWTHEEMSTKLFDHMLSNIKLKNTWEVEYGMTKEDKEFILELINPPPKYWENPGFKPKKGFLYEIVSNKMTGIDVDKFDYFARDALYLGLRSNFDHMRYIYSARVLCEGDGSTNAKTRICCRENDLESLYDLFHTRHLLHRRAYQHKNAIIIERMIIEAFVEANKTDFFTCPPNKKMKLSETVDDLDAYTHVTDHVFHQILCSTDDSDSLKTAREILEKVNTRDLYTCIGIVYFVKREENMKPILKKIFESAKTEQHKLQELKKKFKSAKSQLDEPQLAELKKIWDSDELIDEIINDCENDLKNDLATDTSIGLDLNQFIVTSINMNYGKKNNDPLKKLTFYRKAQKNVLIEVGDNQAVSEMIKPKVFMEHRIVAYCKDKSKKVACQTTFEKWCKKKNYPYLIDV